MSQGLRTYETTSTLARTLVWTDLVADVNEPGRFVINPTTGQRWKRLTVEQDDIAKELVAGSNYREACKHVGIRRTPESASGYVTQLLGKHAPFINRVIELLTEERQSKIVTKDSHLKRLDDLGRRAEKEGRYSAAIAAEVARGRVAGLYSNDLGPEDKKALDSIKDIDSRIKQLLGKVSSEEKAVQGRLIGEQNQDSE